MSEIKKKLQAIDRRSFLKGAGNLMISLPIMDFMLGPASAAFAQTGGKPPLRFLILFNGISIGRYDGSKFVPSNTGLNWTPSMALNPINNFPSLKSYISVVSNLSIPYTGNVFNDGPKFGVDSDFHGVSNGCAFVQLTAMNAREKGASSDQLLKANLNLGSEFIHMNYSVQPKVYFGGGEGYARTQYTANGSYLSPVRDPAQAFTSIITGISSQDTQVETERLRQLKQRKSILDLIDQRRIDYLNRLISSESKARLSDHFDRLRDLEKQVDADIQMTPTASNTCKKSSQPPNNLPIGTDYLGDHPIHNNVTSTMGWSDETRRSQLFRDIVAMALSCDRSRAGTLRLSYDQSFLNANQLIGSGNGSGKAKDYHETTHGTGTLNDLALCTAWHTNEFFKLAEALRSIPEGNGNVLDNTVLIFLSEGGWGSTSDKKGIVPHSGDNMAVMLAGKAGGLKTLGHFKANKEHPCEVILAAMKAVGYTGGSFNRISRAFPGLL